MCGRYQLKDPKRAAELVARMFGAEWPDQAPRYNVAPSQTMPVVADNCHVCTRCSPMRLGYVPAWHKSEPPTLAPINARSEDAFTKPMFRLAVQHRRCLIPADGFYEWQKLDPAGKRKQPFSFSLRGGEPFFFAGLYEETPENIGLYRPETFLLFTTAPNALVAPAHNRMPVILTGDRAHAWLAEGAKIDEASYRELTTPYPAELMECVAVSAAVGNPRNDGPEIFSPAPAGELQLEP